MTIILEMTPYLIIMLLIPLRRPSSGVEMMSFDLFRVVRTRGSMYWPVKLLKMTHSAEDKKRNDTLKCSGNCCTSWDIFMPFSVLNCNIWLCVMLDYVFLLLWSGTTVVVFYSVWSAVEAFICAASESKTNFPTRTIKHIVSCRIVLTEQSRARVGPYLIRFIKNISAIMTLPRDLWM